MFAQKVSVWLSPDCSPQQSKNWLLPGIWCMSHFIAWACVCGSPFLFPGVLFYSTCGLVRMWKCNYTHGACDQWSSLIVVAAARGLYQRTAGVWAVLGETWFYSALQQRQPPSDVNIQRVCLSVHQEGRYATVAALNHLCRILMRFYELYLHSQNPRSALKENGFKLLVSYRRSQYRSKDPTRSFQCWGLNALTAQRWF